MTTGSPNHPLVIGVTGPIGSGVSTVADILREMGFKHYRVSEVIRRDLGAKSLADAAEAVAAGREPAPVDESPAGHRQRLQDHGNARRREHGAKYWVEKALADDTATGPIVIDAVRNLGEVGWLRSKYPSSFVIAVIAVRDTRWERLRDTDAYRGNQALFERDDNRDWDLEENDKTGQQVQKCVMAADYVFVNDEHWGAATAYRAKIRERLIPTIDLMKGGEPRRPTPDEVHMATAYSQSQGSACLKRRVGAVIVDPQGLPLSLGFNENPVSMKPCEHEYGYCFKDNDMEEKMQKRRDAVCPGCGNKNTSLVAPAWACEKCGKDVKKLLFPSRNIELCTAIHAEERAIRSLHGRDAKGATMFVTTFPCFQCARYILDAGITRVVYVEAYPIKESLDFMRKHGVTVDAFSGFKARAFNLIFRGVE